jgi:hypothetical protein
MNQLKRKLAALKEVYNVFSRITAGQDVACTAKCSQCCTADVTLTTLEAYQLFKNMERPGTNALQRRLKAAGDPDRFRPLVTTNQLADICAAGGDPPMEERAREATRCPLLAEDLCTLYDMRPFHCRCMVSRKACEETGSAEMDAYTLALNTVFLQVIEHLDRPGCTGNLLDLLPLVQSEPFREAYENGRCDCSKNDLIANQPLKVLMLPPEYKDRLAPVISSLQSIRL